jgi:hypothetical protein
MVDVNVHFQDIVRLTQRLIELGTDRLASSRRYPVEDHGFVRSRSSWADEYRRIFELVRDAPGSPWAWRFRDGRSIVDALTGECVRQPRRLLRRAESTEALDGGPTSTRSERRAVRSSARRTTYGT